MRRPSAAAIPRRYDLVVIGAGAAGITASRMAAALGARVALVEADRVGGECLWSGCVPSKALLASAARAQDMREADRVGIGAVVPEIDFARVMESVADVIARAAELDDPERLRSAGVEVIEASGRFTGPGRISAGGRELRFRAALVATGSKPRIPDIPGLREARPLTNENVFELRELPRRLVVLGGGPTGCELGQALARLGAEVTLVERDDRLLAGEEPEASEMVESRFRGEGISVRTACEVSAVERAHGELRVQLAAAGVSTEPLACDRVLVALGRRPAADALGLDSIGLSTDPSGAIQTDERMRTAVRHVYAAGDAAGPPYLTHAAGYEGMVALAQALFRVGPRIDHRTIPAATFCDPEVARVGLTEEEARAELGADPLIFSHDHREHDRALTARAHGFSKLVTDRQGKLLGATLVGPAAGDAIAETARLVRQGRGIGNLSQVVHAYPTFAESPVRAAEKWWPHRYLTPRTRRLMRPALALARLLDSPR